MIMKKYFIFAAIATAGLFASCSSSDDVAVSGGQEPIENSEARSAIRLNLATPTMTTRGTGTVGGVGTSTDANYIKNVWSGQSINVFMFTKGTTADDYATTLNLTKNPDYDNTVTTGALSRQYLYNNLEMITPGSDENKIPGMNATADTNSGEAMIEDGTINYYPPAGNYDFFGYHIDGANTATTVTSDGDPAVYYTATDEIPAGKKVGDIKTDATETLWTLPFTIDGTQDLMSTKAVLTEDPTAPTDVTKSQTANMAAASRPNDFYSAYSARRGVHPTLTFNHLLTRLQFSVKAGNDKAAGYEVATPAEYYTPAECNTWNEAGTNVTGALKYAKTYYSFKSWNPVTTTQQYGEGIAEFVEEKVVSAETYTLVKVIKNVDFGNNGGNWEGETFAVKAAQTDLATLGENRLELYTVDVDNSNAIGATLPVKVGNMSELDDDAKDTYNYNLSGARQTTDVKTPATGGLIIENAVYVKSIQVLSENTKGKLAVAWTADADHMQDYQKITWDTEQPSSDINATVNRWLTLKERPYAYKMKTGAAAATYTDLAAYANMTAAEYAALDGNTTPTKQTVDDAVATLTSNITNTVYQTLSVAGMAKYEVDTDVNVDNEQLQDLTPTAPGIDDTKTTPADRYPTKRVGEAIILSPGEYSAPATANDYAAASTASLKMKVKLGQKVPTNWNTPNDREERLQDLDLEIKAPTGGFKQNTSYNIILTVYGLERIEVIAVVQPWVDGGSIGVGADN